MSFANPIVLLNFDSDFTDSSPNGNDFTAVGVTIETASPITVPGSASFDGDDHLTNSSLLDVLPAKVSFPFIFRPEHDFDITNTLNEYFFMKTNIAGSDRFACHLDQTTGKLRFFWEYDNGGVQVILSNSASWTADVDYHVSIEFDGTTVRMYIDGVLQSDTDTTTHISKDGTSQDFVIGETSPLQGFHYHGLIDHFYPHGDVFTTAERALLVAGLRLPILGGRTIERGIERGIGRGIL